MMTTTLDLATLLEEHSRRQRLNKIATFFSGPDRQLYKQHLEFFKAGATYNKRLFLAANRVGKTTGAGVELVYHLTGRYPDWWEGKRFTKGQQWWVVGNRSTTVRAVLQPLLLGEVGSFGTGLIPADALDISTLKDAKKADTSVSVFRVSHVSGSISTVEFKADEQGRKAFEGTERSIWIDEECSPGVYQEALIRTMTGNNIMMMTFTPLDGRTEVVNGFLGEDGDINAHGETGPSKYVVRCTWDDVPHITPEMKRQMLSEIPDYQRDARSKGIPSLGSGAIYAVPEERFVVEPFGIPKHWQKAYGFDVGNNTAIVFLAKDPDTATWYVYDEAFFKGEMPSTHSQAIIARGKWLRGAIDTSARGRSATDGENLFQMYKDLGLQVVNAEKAVEAGIYTIYELLIQGRMKVFDTCKKFLNEYRNYHREDGKIVKKDDHLMDAWRYGVMTGDKTLWTELEAQLELNPPQPVLELPRHHHPGSWALR